MKCTSVFGQSHPGGPSQSCKFVRRVKPALTHTTRVVRAHHCWLNNTPLPCIATRRQEAPLASPQGTHILSAEPLSYNASACTRQECSCYVIAPENRIKARSSQRENGDRKRKSKKVHPSSLLKSNSSTPYKKTQRQFSSCTPSPGMGILNRKVAVRLVFHQTHSYSTCPSKLKWLGSAGRSPHEPTTTTFRHGMARHPHARRRFPTTETPLRRPHMSLGRFRRRGT